MTNQHVIHVGYHKTGTTWLQRDVFPTVQGAVFLPPLHRAGDVYRPLLHNLVNRDHFLSTTFRAALAEQGRPAVISYEALVGSPWGEGHDPYTRAARLAEVAPGAKIIITLRNRDELSKSLYAQYVNEGGHLRPVEFDRSVLSHAYLDSDAAVARFESLFPQVLVLQYDQLRRDPVAAVDEIASFAEVDLSLPENSRRHNQSLKGLRLRFLRRWNSWFRVSPHNPSPLIPLPYAKMMRQVLQRP